MLISCAPPPQAFARPTLMQQFWPRGWRRRMRTRNAQSTIACICASLYAAGVRDTFDALAAHPYAFAQPPDAARDANEGLTFARILDLRDIMVENGDASKPIWITEFGYPTEQPEGYESRVVGEQQQAEYTARAYDKTRTEMPFVGLFTVWNIVRDLPLTDEQSGYSLIRHDGSLKPSFDRVRSIDKDGFFALPEPFLPFSVSPREFVVLRPRRHCSPGGQ